MKPVPYLKTEVYIYSINRSLNVFKKEPLFSTETYIYINRKFILTEAFIYMNRNRHLYEQEPPLLMFFLLILN